MDNFDDGIPLFLRNVARAPKQPFKEKASPTIVTATPIEETSNEDKTDKRSPQDHVRNAQSDLIAEINEKYDAYLEHGEKAEPFNPYEFLKAGDVKPKIASAIVGKFQPQLDEVRDSFKDPELKEAYRGYSANERRGMIAWLTVLIDDTNRWTNIKKASRITKRRTKAKPADSFVKKLKYQMEDRDRKLTSIPPSSIIGAQSLWAFNTKTNQLTFYMARGRAGLSVKGSTIQDFDVEISSTKRLRKPEEIINKVLALGPTTLKRDKILEPLSTIRTEPTGRINEHTILLKVGK
jgi:hypothetical protein